MVRVPWVARVWSDEQIVLVLCNEVHSPQIPCTHTNTTIQNLLLKPPFPDGNKMTSFKAGVELQVSPLSGGAARAAVGQGDAAGHVAYERVLEGRRAALSHRLFLHRCHSFRLSLH